MDFISTSLEQQPLMALFLTIAIGYLLGELSIGGLSLGVGTVLFVALGMGWLAPKAVPPAMLGNFGLALFLYAVGIQYGKQFFIGVTSASGLKDNLVALSGVLISGAVALLFVRLLNLKTAYALGLFAGSGTSTLRCRPPLRPLGNDDPAVGYSVAYPFGVAGPILFLFLAFTLLKPSARGSTGTGTRRESGGIITARPIASRIGRSTDVRSPTRRPASPSRPAHCSRPHLNSRRVYSSCRRTELGVVSLLKCSANERGVRGIDGKCRPPTENH
jgi:putative transport protein